MSNGNENIVHVEAIEGLMSEVNAHIELINARFVKEYAAKEQAMEEANEFQAGIVHDLRTLFEGD